MESFLEQTTFHVDDQPALLRFLDAAPKGLRGAVRNVRCAYEVYCPERYRDVDTQEWP
ncbi:hypothetical protein DOTSEDRAFT_43313 [Dothistroma septosporum NZE10]|uniref:Uncharacterized protein n=1 Tax=Dothistroma septosporum (strain NZE10 / CBS 128990) TaxID=675120 RepID=N1PN69_DOTSN|nr:hypothetical protein DOTSEDRAFT_43313 [Dothistroma septosporum NZE10]